MSSTSPIRFTCTATLPLAPTAIAEQILDLDCWPEFAGYGPLPGIASAQFEVRTSEVVGSRIRVTNRDGSSHVEQIEQWRPESYLRLRLHEFSPPLARWATSFEETWEMEPAGAGARVVRSFAMHATSSRSRWLLWGLSLLLRRAIARHLRQMAGAGG